MPRSTPAARCLTPRGVAAFLEALAETGMVGEAAARAGVPRASLYRRKAADADFAAAWATALEAGLDGLRDEAVRRARDGVEETIWYRGEAVGTVRRYSDQLLMFLLRAHQPALYREPRGDAAAAMQRAEKAARRVESAQDALIADAYEQGRKDGVDEFWESIVNHNRERKPDGLTEQEWADIRAKREAARAGTDGDEREDAADGGGGGPDDRRNAAGGAAGDAGADDAGAETADAAGDDGVAAEPLPRPPARPRPYIPVEEPAAFMRPGRTAGLDYDPLDPYPRDPP